MSTSDSGPAPTADVPAPRGDGDATWVDSFLMTQSGKVYRIEVGGDGPLDVMREAAAEAARTLTDDVVRAAAAPAPSEGDSRG